MSRIRVRRWPAAILAPALITDFASRSLIELPGAYDGILAGAPAINWDRFIPAELWPQVVMRQELGGPIAGCKLAAATQAAVARCDRYDGVGDGVVDDPRRCDFDARSLIGVDTRTRPLCAYPEVARYDGRGDPNTAPSFDCEPN